MQRHDSARLAISPVATRGFYAPSDSLQRVVEQHTKRNRLQEWKTCCCRPLVIIIIIALVLLVIAAIIAIIVTSVADNYAKRLEGSTDDLQQYSANLDELPAALQDQVLQSQQGSYYGGQQRYQQGLGNSGVNYPQYYSNGQQFSNGYPSTYNGVLNNGMQQTRQGFNGQILPYSVQQPSYGYNSNQQYLSNYQNYGRRRR